MSAPDIRYRGYVISYWAKPVPSRAFDWDFEVEGRDDEDDPRWGSAVSLEAAKAEIDEQIEGTL